MAGEAIRGLFGGITQNLGASIAGSAICGALSGFGIKNSGKIEELASWQSWTLLLLALFCLGLAYNAARIAFLRWRRRRAVEAPPENKFSVLVARFVGDDDIYTSRNNVAESIQNDFGASLQVVTWPEELALREGGGDAALAQLEETAKRWLEATHCDVLVWGRVKDKNLVVLYFLSQSGSIYGGKTHQLTDTLELPVTSIAELGGMIAARVADLVDRNKIDATLFQQELKGVADKLGNLRRRMPSALGALTRGSIHYNHALALHHLGMESQLSLLKETVDAYRHALKEWTPDDYPWKWIMAQQNLAAALRRWGSESSNIALLQEAVAANQAILDNFTAGRPGLTAIDRLNAMYNMSVCLGSIGLKLGSTDHLKRACNAVGEAIRLSDGELSKDELARFHSQEGLALRDLAKLTADRETTARARASFGRACQLVSREKHPRRWARYRTHYGELCCTLLWRTKDAKYLEEGLDALREAVSVSRQHGTRWELAQALNELGTAQFISYEHTNNMDDGDDSIASLGEAIELIGTISPRDMRLFERNLANILHEKGARERSTDLVRQAIALYEGAFSSFNGKNDELALGGIWESLGFAKTTLGKIESDAGILLEAVGNLQRALQFKTWQKMPWHFAKVQYKLGVAYEAIANLVPNAGYLDLALRSYDLASVASAVNFSASGIREKSKKKIAHLQRLAAPVSIPNVT